MLASAVKGSKGKGKGPGARNRPVRRPSPPAGLVGPNLEVPLNKDGPGARGGQHSFRLMPPACMSVAVREWRSSRPWRRKPSATGSLCRIAWACLQVDQLLRAGQSAPQDQATGWWQVGELRGCDNYFRVLRCLVVDVRSADRASGHIQALQRCFAQGPKRVSCVWIAAGVGARTHQLPGTPFESGGAAKKGSRCFGAEVAAATSTPCEVPELVQKFSKEKLVASS